MILGFAVSRGEQRLLIDNPRVPWGTLDRGHQERGVAAGHVRYGAVSRAELTPIEEVDNLVERIVTWHLAEGGLTPWFSCEGIQQMAAKPPTIVPSSAATICYAAPG